MDKVLYISGDGFTDSKKKWKIYYNFFDPYSKNYFITNALKLFTKCEIFNVSHSLRHPSFILKLESKHIPGSTYLRTKAIIIINYFINIFIYWKIKLNSYDLIIFSDNLFFITQKLFEDIKTVTYSKLILFSNISPINLLVDSQKSCIPYYDMICFSDSGHENEWEDLYAEAAGLRVLRIVTINESGNYSPQPMPMARMEVMASDKAKELSAKTGALIYWEDADAAKAQIAKDTATLGTVAKLIGN